MFDFKNLLQSSAGSANDMCWSLLAFESALTLLLKGPVVHCFSALPDTTGCAFGEQHPALDNKERPAHTTRQMLCHQAALTR